MPSPLSSTRHWLGSSLLPVLSALLLTLLLSLSLSAGERAKITILSTTDLHGNILPLNYFTNKPEQKGLAKVATLIHQARKANPKALLIDIGDTIQGAPTSYYHASKNPAPIDPMMLVMNELQYDSMTLGNHEFNFGLPTLQKARSEAKFPWLSANILDSTTKAPAFAPYLIKEIDGVRVAILGITTVGIPHWEDARHIPGLEFQNPIEAARKWVAELREKQKVDVVIVAAHMGLEEDLATGFKQPGQIPNENTALAIARSVPGIDLMFLGHSHRDTPALVVNGVLFAQAGHWGNRLAQAEVFLEKSPEGRWVILGKSSKTIPVAEAVTADPAIVKLVTPYHEETQAWLDKSIGSCAAELNGRRSRLEDSALIDLIHKVQLEAGQADVSFAASFNLEARIHAGPITVRDIYSLYTYENTLVVVEGTGKVVKDALEVAAKYYLPYAAGRSAEQLTDTRAPGYNFDSAEGVSYTLDLNRPQGDRIVDLKYKGAPLAPEQKLKIVVNSYRFAGGGNYGMFKNLPVVHRSSDEVRDLIIEWIDKHKQIPTTASQNWKISLTPQPEN